VATLRPAAMIAGKPPSKALRLALHEQRLCEEFELGPFSESDAALFLQQRAPASAWPEAAVQRLHQQTGGLPLFLATIADGWNDALPITATSPELPRSLFDLIERQHACLPEPMQRWLEVAAVAGPDFVHAPLADALEVDADKLQVAFDALVRQRAWLREIGPVTLPDGRVGVRYAFHHAVHQQVLYQRAGAAGRVQWHRRLGAALLKAHGRQGDAVAAEVAVHFEKGHDPAGAVRHLALAAQRALQRFASADAADIAQRALALIEGLPDREALRDTEVELDVVLGVALAALEGMASPATGRAFGRSVRLMDGLQATGARLPALHGIWWATLVRGQVASARGMASMALELAQQRDDPALRFAGDAAMGITLVHIGDFAAAQAHLLQALEARQGLGAAAPTAMFTFDPVVQLTSYLAESLWWLGRADEAGRCSSRALAHAEVLNHPPSLRFALDLAALLRGHSGDFEGAAALSRRALRLGSPQRLEQGTGTNPWTGQWVSQWVHGRARVALGEIDEGLREMQVGLLAQQQGGLVHGLTRGHAWLAQASLDAAHLDVAERALRDGLTQAERTGEHGALSLLHLLQGQLQYRRGRLAEAQAAFAEALAVARLQGAVALEAAALAAASAASGER